MARRIHYLIHDIGGESQLAVKGQRKLLSILRSWQVPIDKNRLSNITKGEGSVEVESMNGSQVFIEELLEWDEMARN